jgi:quercetin dioxygenase-like cupin family protein
MPLISADSSPRFAIPGLRVVGRAAPSRGARESCVWEVEVAPGSPGTPHQLSREEIFLCIGGHGEAEVAGERVALAPGDTLVVPANTSFCLANPGSEPFRAVCVLPVGGQAQLPGGAPFTPPWAE